MGEAADDRRARRRGLGLARFQAEWIPVGRPEGAPALTFRAHSDALAIAIGAGRIMERPDGKRCRLRR
jgi:hypothetical protein